MAQIGPAGKKQICKHTTMTESAVLKSSDCNEWPPLSIAEIQDRISLITMYVCMWSKIKSRFFGRFVLLSCTLYFSTPLALVAVLSLAKICVNCCSDCNTLIFTSYTTFPLHWLCIGGRSRPLQKRAPLVS